MKTILITYFFISLGLLGFSEESIPNWKSENVISNENIDTTYINLDKNRNSELIEKIQNNLEYSGILNENGIEGKVKLNCRLNESGVFDKIEIIETDHPQLVFECIAALNLCNRIPFQTYKVERFQVTFVFNCFIIADKKFENGCFFIFKKEINH